MSLPTFPESQAAFLATLNGDAYDAESNAGGMAAGGHRPNFPLAMTDIATLATYFNDLAIVLQAMAEQVEDDAASAAAGSGTEATAAAIRSGVNAFYMSIRRAYEASVPVALTDASTIAWDMSGSINVDVTIGAAGRSMGNPTSKVSGKSGLLTVIQGSGGNKSVTIWGSDFKWIGDQPTWPTAAGAATLISYFVRPSGEIWLNWGGNKE